MTVHTARDAAYQAHINREIEATAALADTLHTVRQRMRDGEADEYLLDAVVQKPPTRASYDIYDAYAYAWVEQAIHQGNLYHAWIELGKTPGRDADTEGNNEKLAHLPDPYTATFIGGAGEGDGALEWSRPADFLRTRIEKGARESDVVEVPPRQAVLEVGTTSASRTVAWLNRNYPLARWPYRMDAVCVLFPRPGWVSEMWHRLFDAAPAPATVRARGGGR